MIPVQLYYLTGLSSHEFTNARLVGSWDASGLYSDTWSSTPMQAITADDGCPAFTAAIQLDPGQVGREFHWGVLVDGPQGPNLWGVALETDDLSQVDRYRSFVLQQPGPSGIQTARYYLTNCRRLGAQPYYPSPTAPRGIRFAVWAPNARAVEVVFGSSSNGYIADDGYGMDPALPPVPLLKGEDGVWQADGSNDSRLLDFNRFAGVPYMFRVTRDDGSVAYRTDLYSRSQIGSGTSDPGGAHFSGSPSQLDGAKGCSVVIDPETVARDLTTDGAPAVQIPESDFWHDEFRTGFTVPARLEDMIIYELHIPSLGVGAGGPGNITDAVQFLDHLGDLGVNAVELLPMAEYDGSAGWGYGDTHHFAIESICGTRDQYKYFVRECHRRGIAVIQDVVYNHFDGNAERAEWQYDSTAPERNIYYWYEGQASNYSRPDGGYLNNGSTGYAPRYWEEMVRAMFISSAVALAEEFHVDGFRVDLTSAIHRDNSLNDNGASVGNANQLGAKLLREWSRTLQFIKPSVVLVAEDYSGWDAVTKRTSAGGLGFDAIWYADFYHHLIGDAANCGSQYARLINTVGSGGDEPLAMDYFAGALQWSGHNNTVYHENHDEAGNDQGTKRTIVDAVNDAPLSDGIRRYAEARSRFACGMSLLSAGTPLFFMGEEVGATKPFRYNDFLNNREDLPGLRQGTGASLFRFYQDVTRLRRNHPGLRSPDVDIVHIDNTNRLLAFRRREPSEELLVVASLNNSPFSNGYWMQASSAVLPDGQWQEVFNSDSSFYGGDNIGNFSAAVPSSNGAIQVNVPANGFVVFLQR